LGATEEGKLRLLQLHRCAKPGRADLEHLDALWLREMGLNPEDFRDAFGGRSRSVLFTPFRDCPPKR
jgi:hypothetical protein